MMDALPQPTVLHAIAREHYWQGVGALSIKTFVRGRGMYSSDHARFAVDSSCFLLLNHDQPYTIVVESLQPVESLCVFFPRGFVEHAALLDDAVLLEQPWNSDVAPFAVVDRTYPHDAALAAVLAQVHKHVTQPTPAVDATELHHALARQVIRSQHGVATEIADLALVRANLRAEIYRRLHHARDYIHACYDQPLTLNEIANVALLSPNHLLRRFNLVFGTTPHQYLTAVRLDHAQRLLRHSSMLISEICLAVGFASLGSFSWLFHQRFGMSPQAFRATR